MTKIEIIESLRGWIERRRLSQDANEDNAHFAAELEYCDDMIFEACKRYIESFGFGILPLQGREERRHLYSWVSAEEDYVANKFDDQRMGHDESMREEGLQNTGFWLRQIVQYYDRARIALEASQAERFSGNARGARQLEMRGQQALAKAMMTAKGCVESSIRVFGKMPRPGVSSGEIQDWDGEDFDHEQVEL